MFRRTSEKLGINEYNLKIYVGGLFLSIAFTIPYFYYQTPAFTILCSIGASGIGAVVLGFFIERANNQSEKRRIEKFRDAQLNHIMLSATNAIERTAYWYFRISSEIIGDKMNQECKSISYDVIWKKFEEIEKEWTNVYYSNPIPNYSYKNMELYLKNMIAQYHIIANHLNILLVNIDLYEAEGFFSHNEVMNLKCAFEFFKDIYFDVADLQTDNFKFAFNSLLDVKEFEALKSAIVFYCDKKTLTKINNKTILKRGLDEESVISAITIS